MNKLINADIEAYAQAHSAPESALCRALREETEQCMESPQMVIGPLEGAFLKMITQLVRATSVLEIGMFTGYALERYTRIGPDHIMYEATIEDPKVFTRPWKIKMPLYRRIEENATFMEYRCVESVEELMYGYLRKEQLVRRWEGDYGRRGGTLVLEVTRKPTSREDEP